MVGRGSPPARDGSLTTGQGKTRVPAKAEGLATTLSGQEKVLPNVL